MTRWFRANWPVRILTVLVGVLALAAVVTPGWLAPAANRAVITLPSIAPLDGGLRWTDSATPADAIQRMAVDQLLGWLGVLGWGSLAVGGITALAWWAALAGERVPEVAIRRAVGASRRSLIGAALGEGAWIGAVAIGLGVGLGRLGVEGAVATWPGGSSSAEFGVPVVALIAIGVVMGLGALLPLFSARSRTVTEPVEAPPPLWIPAIQLGVGLATLVGAVMIAGQARATLSPTGTPAADSGEVYQLEHLGVIETRARDYGQLLTELGRRDSAAVISLASPGGHDGIGTVDQLTTDCGQCYVGGIYLKWRPLRANYHSASADTFRARGFPMLAGRAFTDEDRVGAAPVAIVNQYLADRYFESAGPLGRDVFLAGRMIGAAYRVVGVVDDRGPRGLGGELGPLETIYLSTLQAPGKHTELLIVGGHPGELPLPGGVTVASQTTRAAIVRQREAALRWFGWLFGIEGAVTLVLAVSGIAILMMMWVTASGTEFAIRRSVGARRWQIRRYVLGQAVTAAGAGVGLGVVFFGPVLWPEIAQLVPGVSYWQPGLVVAVASGLAVVAVVAAVGPAWRASRSSPAELTTDR